jgi:hypothetical protein
MAGSLDDLVAAAVRAWLTVARAWIEAANAIGVALLDLPAVESGRTGFNREVVVLPAQPAPTAVHPEGFSNWDYHELPPPALAVDPSDVDAGVVTEITVVVHPPEGAASGTYVGSLCDPNGACLLDEVGVYVVGDRSP